MPLPNPPSLFEQRAVIEEHYRLAQEIYGPNACGRQMRKFAIKYSRLHPDSLATRDAFIAVKQPEELRQVLDRLYSEDFPGRHPDCVDETASCEEG
jgi:tRNA-dihydrouridine synthase